MTRTLYAIAAFAIITFAACKPDDEIHVVPDKGAIRFINQSADLYDFFLDDARYGDLYGGDSATFGNIGAGVHRVKALQKSNIVDTPKLRQQVVIVYKDSVSIFIFP